MALAGFAVQALRHRGAAFQADEKFLAAFDHRPVAERQQHAAQLGVGNAAERGQFGIADEAAGARPLTRRRRQAFEPVRPQRQPVEYAAAYRGVERERQIGVDRERLAAIASARQSRHGAAMLHRPQQRAEPHGIDAEQRLDINRLAAEPHPKPPQLL